MGLPSKQRTRTSKRQRASHFALSGIVLHTCEKCKKAKVPHHACPSCGYYQGRKVVNVEKRKARREQRLKMVK